MPKFIVRQYRDAVVVFSCEVQAETPDAAFEKARTEDQNWVEESRATYDNADAAVYADDGKTELRESANLW